MLLQAARLEIVTLNMAIKFYFLILYIAISHLLSKVSKTVNMISIPGFSFLVRRNIGLLARCLDGLVLGANNALLGQLVRPNSLLVMHSRILTVLELIGLLLILTGLVHAVPMIICAQPIYKLK